MNRTVFSLYFALVMIAMPVVAYAEGESFNPPGWAGATMFALALILPLATYVWMRSRN